MRHVDKSFASSTLAFIRERMWAVFGISGVALVALAVLLVPRGADAQVGVLTQGLVAIFGGTMWLTLWFFGQVLSLVIYVLTLVASYNGFLGSPAVQVGWVIVRDICNMFFIVALLVVAFATILNLSSYQWKKMLPQLIISALLINFSKTIAGLFIDFSQIITLTFVNGFAQTAGGNFADLFQIGQVVSISPTASAVSDLDALGGILLANVMVLIALVTVLIMTVILAFRIVMLWSLVVLSPIPYLLRPLGNRAAKYGQKWWDEFFNYLIVGPVLAFFIWLALSLSSTQVANQFQGKIAAPFVSALSTQGASWNSVITFIISISMLVAGLKLASEFGVIGSGLAKDFGGWMKKTGVGLAKGTGKYAAGATVGRMAESKLSQRMLTRVAASGVPLVNDLALGGLTKIQSAQKKRAKEADEKLSGVKDVRVLERLAGGFAVGQGARDIRRAAQRRVPRTTEEYDRLGLEGQKALSPGQLRRARLDGVIDDGRALDILQRGGTTTEQNAVADLGRTKAGAVLPVAFDNYPDWLRNERDLEAADSLGPGAHTREERAEAERQARMVVQGDRATPLAPTNATPLRGYTPRGSGLETSLDIKYYAGVDEEKQLRTREKVEAYDARGEDFYASPEFQQNAAQFYPQDVYKENERAGNAVARSREREAAGTSSGVSGASSLVRRLDRAEREGGAGPLKQVRLAADFASLGLSPDAPGAHLTGDAKAQTAGKMKGMLMRQGFSTENVGKVMGAIQSADALNLVNKGRTAGDARYTLSHESIHGQLEDLDPVKLKAVWESIPEPERKGITEKFRKEWKSPNMPEEEVMHEYFADGLANATTNKRAGGVQLPQGMALQFKALGMKMYEREGGGVAPKVRRTMEASERPAREQPKAAAPQVDLGPAVAKAMEELSSAPAEGLKEIWGQLTAEQQEAIRTAFATRPAGAEPSAGFDADALKKALADGLARNVAGRSDGPVILPDPIIRQLRQLGVKLDAIRNVLGKKPPTE